MALKVFFVEVPPVVRPGRVHFSAPLCIYIPILTFFSLSQNDCRMPLPMESDSSCEQDFINHTPMVVLVTRRVFRFCWVLSVNLSEGAIANRAR